MAASGKVEKCIDLGARYVFEPIAGAYSFKASARLLNDIERRISVNSGDGYRDKLSVSEDLDIGAAFQCCPLKLNR